MVVTADQAAIPAQTRGKSQAAFRTISEVADELDVAQHVLRFWESKFPQVRPLKRGGGRRYYRPEDIDLLREIRTLLYDEGYTIKGAQKLLRQRRARPPAVARTTEKPSPPAPAPPPAATDPEPDPAPDGSDGAAAPPPAASAAQAPDRARLHQLRDSLVALREELAAALAEAEG
ncbi:MAG: MerR family transcriptional regulator [Geminicoccaceae bacterium]